MPAVDLVLEGGGVKGIGLVGAISVLEEHGFTFRRVAGTSAGAIVGSLVAAGMGGDQLRQLMATVDYTQFRDEDLLDRVPVVGKGLALVFDKGIYRGNALREWLGTQLESLGVRTFADLADDDPDSSLPPDQRYRLVVMASDVSRGRLRRFPWDYPQFGLDSAAQPVVDAVRASMSILFFYRPVTLRDVDGPQSFLVDGGMLSNFPVDTFDRTDGRPPRWPTIGIKLSARPQANQVEHDVKGDITLIEAMIGTMMSFHDQMHLDDPAVLARTIFVDTFKVKATDFGIDRATQDALYQSGRSAAQKFLDSRPTEAAPARAMDPGQ